MATIFGEGDPYGLPSLPVVAAPDVGGMAEIKSNEVEEDEPTALPANMPVYSKHIKALTDRDYDASIALTWTRALATWLAIIQSSSYQSSVGRHVEHLLEQKDRESALQCIRDACGVRSPKTALKRAQDLQSFIRYRGHEGWWPLDETDLINYLEWCQRQKKSKITGKNLKHSLKFFRYVMGAHFDEEEVLGPVFVGRASRIGATKEARVQARALTVEEVEKLEEAVVKGQNPIDRYFAGCLLFCLYSRARWSGIANVDSIEWDVADVGKEKYGFVETRTRITKTSTTEEKKTMWMPFVAPINGLGPFPWGLAWKEVLESLGFNLMHRPFGPICRAPCANGDFSKRSVSTAEASDLLTDFLKVKGEKMTSHSLKTTTLVWAARFGLSDRSRAILGHHSIKDQSMACYSRDLLTGPTRELCAMLLNIKNGKFKPDSTRSGWLASRLDRLQFPAGPGTPGTPASRVPQTPWHRPVDMAEVFGDQDETLETLFGDLSGLDKVNVEEDQCLSERSRDEIPAAQPSVASWEEVEPTGQMEEDPDIAKLKTFMSGAWPGPDEEEMEELDEMTGDEFVDTASSGTDDGDVDSETDGEEAFYESQDVGHRDIPVAVPGNLVQNHNSKMLHKVADGDRWKLQCGASVGNTIHLPNGSRFHWPLCARCFKDNNEQSKGLAESLETAKRRRVAP